MFKYKFVAKMIKKLSFYFVLSK